MLYIEDIAFYIPETNLSIIDNNKELGLSPLVAKVYTKGCGLLYSPRFNNNSYTLLSKSIENLLAEQPTNSKIAYLIYAHTGSVSKSNNMSYINNIKLFNKLSNANAWSLSSQDCVSGLQALKTLNCLNIGDKKALLIIGEVPPNIMRIVPGVAIVGDASVAILVSNTNGMEVLTTHIMVDKNYSDGAFMSYTKSQAYEVDFIDNLAITINKTLDLSHKKLTDINLIIPSNTNVRTWEVLAKKLKIPFENFYTANITKYGHCLGCDTFINLAIAKKSQIITSGDLVLLLFTGIGGQFGSAIIRV